MSDDLPNVCHPVAFRDSTSDQIQAVKYHYAYLDDPNFQKWSQKQFFRHIRDSLPGIKTVHFFCFEFPSAETCSTLPGVIFNTPLVVLSGAEIHNLEWTQNSHDSRSNHLNDHNNCAMANLILDSIRDYNPGVYPVPYANFYQAKHKKFVDLLDHYSADTNHWI